MMRDRLVKAGIKHLREFGYPSVDETNILTDYVFRKFFKKMLEGTIEAAGNASICKACEALIVEIDKAKDPA